MHIKYEFHDAMYTIVDGHLYVIIQCQNLMKDPITPTQVGLSTRGNGHKKYQKVFIEEVQRYYGDDLWADERLPFPHLW